jgi:uncharacterized protein (DUF488 family)
MSEPAVTLFTIGFTKKSASQFFTALTDAGVSGVIDVRLSNVSQLAGFAKRADLAYFLGAICDIGYDHHPELAPDEALLGAYKQKAITWPEYERRFNLLIRERRIERGFERGSLERRCLLCSEPTPDRCHRRLVAEYLADTLGNVSLCHL